jgi:hypothetical protein
MGKALVFVDRITGRQRLEFITKVGINPCVYPSKIRKRIDTWVYPSKIRKRIDTWVYPYISTKRFSCLRNSMKI